MALADPRIAALHLHGPLEAEWLNRLNRFLLQTLASISAEEINATVQRAMAAFMAADGPVNGPVPGWCPAQGEKKEPFASELLLI